MGAAGRPIRVLFLFQRPEAWINLASVYAAMHEDPGVEPLVWLLPYNDADQALGESRAGEARSVLKANGVPYVEWRHGMHLRRGEFDVAIFNHPYDRERPPPLWFSRVTDSIPHTIYIPYGLPMGGGRKNLRLQYAQPTQARASAVVARSPFEKAQYAKHCPSGDQHVHILGHPRFDVLLDALQKPVQDHMARFCRGRTVVLWSSHFSFGHAYSQSSNFSTFDLIGPELFEYAIEHRADICLLWRPHPVLFPMLVRDGVMTETDLSRLRIELDASGILLDEQPGHAAAFRVSNALIADTGSFFLEYLVTGNPVLALVNPEGEPLNEEGEALLAHYCRASTPREVEEFIAAVQAGSVNQSLNEARTNHLPILDGSAGIRVAALAKSLVNGLEGDSELESESAAAASTLFRCQAGLQQGRLDNGQVFPVAPTPTLDKLCASLREIRRQKRDESGVRKRIRRSINSVRAGVAEYLKHQASIGKILELARCRHHVRPR
jgi:hypothetical protein